MTKTTTNTWLEAALKQHVHTSTDAGKYLLYFLGRQGELMDMFKADLVANPTGEEWGDVIYRFYLAVTGVIRGYTVASRTGGITPAETFNHIEFSHVLCNYIGYMLGGDVGDYLRIQFFPEE